MTDYDWLIDADTGEIQHDEIAKRARVEAESIVADAAGRFAANPLDRWARMRADLGVEHFVERLIEGWTHHAEFKNWSWRVKRGDLSDSVTLSDAEIKGLSSDRWAS